jgi:hypothetical protein
MKKTITGMAVALTVCIAAGAQQNDSLLLMRDTSMLRPGFSINDALVKIHERKQKIKSMIIPAALITYGFIAQSSEDLRMFDVSIKNEIRKDRPYFYTKIDDYLQYAPAVAVYGLNAIGIKGKNNFRDRTMIYLLSTVVTGVTVQSLKAITKVQRPDGFGTNAFPSGHTATAFAAAEFLRMEYKDVSPWYGIAGYLAATTTGILRMYNNRHWFRDILPGAGFGILSTRVAYWVYPAIKRKFFKDKPMNTMVMPYYQNGGGGIALVYNFNH